MPSTVSGTDMVVYDERTPQLWMLPLRDTIVPGITVIAPKAGYLVPAEYAAQVGAALRLHGIESRTLATPQANAEVESFIADRKFAAAPSEGYQCTTLTGNWKPASANLVAGALFVPIAQAKARLVMAILEPQAPDSIAAWGGFNNSFERKEYMESYVAEEQARLMLAKKIPRCRPEFDKKLKDDPEFAKNPMARLDFFARRHPAWDLGYNRYPVLRTGTAY